jgi:predicted dehydrogenase/sugar phosphate isomerase/epimerase
LKNFNLIPLGIDIVPGYFNSDKASEVRTFIMKSVDLAVGIGAKFVTIPSGKAVSSSEWLGVVDRIRPYFVEMADYAEKNKIVFSIEAPHLNTLAENVEQTVAFFETINDPRVKCTFDTSHVSRGRRSSLVEGLNKIGIERIQQIHLRDSLGEDISITPGKGRADFVPFINELKKLEFKGCLIFELENEGYTTQQKEKELRFAYSYIQNIIKYSDVPFTQKIMTSEFYKLMERIVRNPKAEVKRHKKLHNLARRIKRNLYLFAPIKTYEGVWKNRWHIRRNRVIEHRPHTVILKENLDRLIKVGIIGCGYAGATMHGPGFHRLNNVRIVGAIDIDKTKAFRTAKKFKCNYYTNLDEMVEKEKPDLVSVCTREWQHYEPIIRLLNSGADVFCEKIMASRYKHGLEMVEAAEKNGGVLAINYNYRFMPGIQKIREIIQSGYLGKLALIDIRVHAFSYHHALDLIFFLGGKIKSVSAYYHNDNSIREFGGTDWSQYDEDILYVPSTNLSATFELENDALATISSSYYLNHLGFILSIDAVCENGAVSLTGLNMFNTLGILTHTSNRKLNHFNWGHKQSVFSKGYEYTFYKSIESFMNSYLNGRRPETDGDHGLFMMRLEKAVSESFRNECKVYL